MAHSPDGPDQYYDNAAYVRTVHDRRQARGPQHIREHAGDDARRKSEADRSQRPMEALSPGTGR